MRARVFSVAISKGSCDIFGAIKWVRTHQYKVNNMMATDTHFVFYQRKYLACADYQRIECEDGVIITVIKA
jgi:hypothetical protein